jgi:AraC family transcriptional regulator
MPPDNKYLVEEYRGRIYRVMDYIEKNLSKTMSLEELSSVANFSKFHFSRIFWGMTGETPFQFLARIRMEKAASQLVFNPKEPVAEIAFQCGYPNLSVFSRNFKTHFGMSPTQWRDRNMGQTNSNQDQPLSNPGQPEPKTSIYLSDQYEPLKWRTNMELCKGVEVKELPEMTVAYVRHVGPYKGDEKLFEGLFNKLFAWAGPRGLLNQPGLKTVTLYHDDPEVTDEQNLRMSVGLPVSADTKVDGEIGKMDVEGGKHVVASFTLGAQDYQKAWSWLFGEWFPASGFQPDDGPSMEMCSDKTEDGRHVVDICVPVKPL